jgi:D-sedoheptulose 7-phosphate isomerase
VSVIDEIRHDVRRALSDSAAVHAQLDTSCADSIAQAAQLLLTCFRNGGKLLLFGNGGSAADSQHVAAEFVGRFVKTRDPLPAIALTTDSSALTAIGNDFGFGEVFARQVRALGRPGDVAVAISTSGRSPNVLAATRTARALGIHVIGLTGGDGGELIAAADIAIVAPSHVTARVQECHLAIVHTLCEVVEEQLFFREQVPPATETDGAPPARGAVAGT